MRLIRGAPGGIPLEAMDVDGGVTLKTVESSTVNNRGAAGVPARKVCPVCGRQYRRLELQRKNDRLYLLAVHVENGRRRRCYIGRVASEYNDDPVEKVVDVARGLADIVERDPSKYQLLKAFAGFLRELADEAETVALIYKLKATVEGGSREGSPANLP